MNDDTDTGAREIQAAVFYKPLAETADPYDFRPRPEEYDRLAEEEVAGPKESAPEPAESTEPTTPENPENPEAPAGADEDGKTRTETSPEPPSEPSTAKTSTGKSRPPVEI